MGFTVAAYCTKTENPGVEKNNDGKNPFSWALLLKSGVFFEIYIQLLDRYPILYTLIHQHFRNTLDKRN